jgi:hypothetical protein
MVWLLVLPSGPPKTSPAHTGQELRTASRPASARDAKEVIGPLMRSDSLEKTAKGI